MTWYEDDDFWHLFEPLLFDAERLGAAEAECEAIIDLTHLQAKADVLDLAAGVGRHAVPFAQRGHQVTAVDRTTHYLDKAKARAKSAGVSLELVAEDMRHFSRPQSYDLALNLYTSFGFFSDEQDNLRVAENLYHSLRPDGYAVLEMTSKEILARDWRERDWRESAEGALILEERKVKDHFSRASCRWLMVTKSGCRREYCFEHRLYSASELVALLTQAGFGEVKIYGDLEGAPFDQEASRMVAVAKA
ncbi:MAG: class I SAM-dependent methyltransferase [Deltaproteobacteria bacterium]|nr:class I SAM-dependent methyltransferase [Deltaproteobacteria bacterium]